MPQEMEREIPAEQEGRPQPPKREDKKKPRGGGRFRRLVMLGLFAVGVSLGLHFSGVVDMRDLVFRAVYGIPKVGPSLGAALGIPSIYAMSSPDRRMMEIRLLEDHLAKLKAQVDKEKERNEAISADLMERSRQVAKLQEELQVKLKELAASDDTKPRVRLESLDDVLKTYRDMSPRNAAQIIGKMDDDLAVEILSRLPNDQAAKILGRMDADRAARLTERLANKDKP